MTGESELLVTGDGSHTIHSRQYDVPYHSRHGAIQESQHVFLDAGLRPLLGEPTAKQQLHILEMGFGTGLNALLTLLESRSYPGVNFHYHALERYPLGPTRLEQLNYPAQLATPRQTFTQLHEVPGNGREHPIEANFNLAISTTDFLAGPPAGWPAGAYDVLYYDAFAPSSQPELWTPEAMRMAHQWLRPGGLFVTYCAKGQFKRDLRDAGFLVEPLPGPPGKREMTRGHKK